MKKESSLGWRRWASFLLVGLAGQLAWAIENQYINLWVFSQSGNVSHITWMTMASAIVATLTTFFMGALSDRLGKRKLFIAGGYTLWGIFVFLFGIMSLGNLTNLTHDQEKAILLVGITNTAVDCVMTFFGSTANDACFNAMVVDQTNTKNRPFVQSVLSVLPLIAVVMMMGIGLICGVPGEAGASAGQVAKPWLIFFLICGAITSLTGIVSFFLLPKDEIKPNRDEPYLKNLVYGFRPSSIKKHPNFYLALLTFLFFNIAVDAFMPYYLVYFTVSLGLGGMEFYGLMAIVLGVSMAIAITLGAFMNKIGKLKLLIPSILIMAVGAFLLFFVSSFALVSISAMLLMSGYLVGTAVLSAELGDQTPKEDVGVLQGVRMVFAVMLPMIIGSKISELCFQSQYYNDYGELAKKPDQWMFVVTAIAAVLALIPAFFLLKASSKGEKDD